MTRVFLSLAILANASLMAVFWLGWRIGDARVSDPSVQRDVAWHVLAGMSGLVFAILTHALVLTYFMGTGRWLEETCRAYQLSDSYQASNRAMKWRMYPAMVGALLMLIGTGALGAAADPASAVAFRGVGPLNAAQVHMSMALLTLLVNVAVNALEFAALGRNNVLVNLVLGRVRDIRLARKLPVE